MAVLNNPPQQQTVRRIWKAPGSRWNWFFLVSSLLTLGWVYFIYRAAIATQQYPGPYNDPFRQFGIVTFVLVLLVAAYTLRRRFVRRLPGKVHTWLWLHIWFGVISVLIAFMHDNYQNVTHDFAFDANRFTEASFGTSALYALVVLVGTGVIGRLLDLRQARVIATEADMNGVGITRSVKERLHDLTLTIERLNAGKSPQFKQYCEEAMRRNEQRLQVPPLLPARETADFQSMCVTLEEYATLTHSLHRQQRAQAIMRTWRSIHIPLACAALMIIAYHSLIELWKMLFLH